MEIRWVWVMTGSKYDPNCPEENGNYTWGIFEFEQEAFDSAQYMLEWELDFDSPGNWTKDECGGYHYRSGQEKFVIDIVKYPLYNSQGMYGSIKEKTIWPIEVYNNDRDGKQGYAIGKTFVGVWADEMEALIAAMNIITKNDHGRVNRLSRNEYGGYNYDSKNSAFSISIGKTRVS